MARLVSNRTVLMKDKDNARTSLVVQWLRLRTSNAGDTGSIPGPGRSHMPRGVAKQTKNRAHEGHI